MRVLLIALLLVGCSAPTPQYKLVPVNKKPIYIPACEEQKRAVEQWNKENPTLPKKVSMC
jgi:hypothetical protein